MFSHSKILQLFNYELIQSSAGHSQSFGFSQSMRTAKGNILKSIIPKMMDAFIFNSIYMQQLVVSGRIIANLWDPFGRGLWIGSL